MRSLGYEYSVEDYENVILAIFFHDVIYDTTLSDSKNVDLSKIYCKEFLEKSVSMNRDRIFDICGIIESTDYTINMLCGDPPIYSYMRDLDLLGFAAKPDDFQQTSDNIRKEFWNVSDVDFIKGRLEFMRNMQIKGVFSCRYFWPYEETAQENISKEIERLERFALHQKWG